MLTDLNILFASQTAACHPPFYSLYLGFTVFTIPKSQVSQHHLSRLSHSAVQYKFVPAAAGSALVPLLFTGVSVMPPGVRP